MPIFLRCQRCAACCKWPGQVHVNDEEIARLAILMGMSETAFIEEFTQLARERNGLVLQEKPNGECVLLEGSNCLAQSAKPQQCRDFPNLWSNHDSRETCRAESVSVTKQDYRQLLAQATGRPLATSD